VYDEDLANMDEWVRRLKIEYDIFFNGNRRRPPDDLRMRVERLVKRLAEATDLSFAQRFRYNTLLARFCVYRDLWRRTQQERESADDAREKTAPAGQNPPLNPRTASPIGEVQVSISDPEAEADKIRHLYDELLHMRGNHAKEMPVNSYQQFADYIGAQTQFIRQKYQCANVTFRIALEDKAVKFTAKAADSSSR